MNPHPDQAEDTSSPESSRRARWGQLNRGQLYTIIALDVDRAISVAGLNDYEQVLIQQARELCWGRATRSKKERGEQWPAAKGCRLNISALARKTKLPPNRLYEARRSLKSSGILSVCDGETTINKQADQWIHPASGLPRLSPALLAYCAEVRPSIQAELPLGEDDQGPEIIRKSGQGVSGNPDTSIRKSGQGVSGNPDTSIRISGYSHVEDRARGIENSIEKKRRGGEAIPPSDFSLVEDKDPGMDPRQVALRELLKSEDGRAK
jgi:hypothetical protein